MAAKNTAWQAIIALKRRVCYLRAVVHRLCPGARSRVSAWSRRPSQSGKEPCRFGHHEKTQRMNPDGQPIAYRFHPCYRWSNLSIYASLFRLSPSQWAVPGVLYHAPGCIYTVFCLASHVGVAKYSPLTRLSTISRVVTTSVLLCTLLYNAIRSEGINPWPPLSHGKPGDSTTTRRSIKEPHMSISVLESMGLSQPRRSRLRFG